LEEKKTLVIAGIIGIGGAVANALAWTTWFFGFCRIIFGLSVGLISTVAPLYVSETASKDYRGLLVTSFQLSVTFGIFLAYVLGLGFSHVPDGWKYITGFSGFPGVMLLLSIFLPESPRWLSSNEDTEAMLQGSINKSYNIEPNKLSIWYRALGALITSLMLAIANQLTGINAIIYYAPSIMSSAGLPSLIATVGIGAWNMVTTLIAVFLVDRVGRRPLLLGGLLIMCISELIVAAGFYFFENEATPKAAFVITGIVIFILGFELGPGPLFFVISSEIFPQAIRGQALGIASLATWGLNLLLSTTFPLMRANIGSTNSFIIFFGFGVVTFVYSLLFIKETKGKQLENISA